MSAKPFSVEKYFTEREVVLDVSSAEQFYSMLRAELKDEYAYQHGHMGVQKRDDNDFNRLVPLKDERVLFYRGQSDSSWGLSSSLYRLIQKRFRDKIKMSEVEKVAKSVEKRLLEVARSNGLVRNLSALELMTVLQHHGAPTRLLDVTTDWKVALYFACESLWEVDGRLFLITVTPSAWGSFPRMQEGSTDLVWWDRGVLKDRLDQWNERVWPVLLPFVDARMIAQQGYYLVGGMNVNMGKRQYRSTVNCIRKRLNSADMLKVSSLSIFFPNGRGVSGRSLNKRLESLLSDEDGTWYSSCVSVRIPAAFKAGLLECLRKDGVYPDSIFPPVSETERLLSYVAKEAVTPHGEED